MRTSIRLLTVSICLIMAANGFADENSVITEISPSAVARATREHEKRVLHSLGQRVQIEAVDCPLNEVIQQISHGIDREILIDKAALADEGISLDQIVTLNLGELSVLQAFYFLLEPLDLAWVAGDGVLEVTTKTKALEKPVIRVYDVHAICELLSPLVKGIPLPARPSTGGIGCVIIRLPQGGGMFSVPVEAAAIASLGQLGSTPPSVTSGRSEIKATGSTSPEEWLIRVIEQIPSSRWIIQDGEGGAIQWSSGILIVSQSDQTHLEIAGLLRAMQRLLSGQVAGKSVSARRLGYPTEQDAAIIKALCKPSNLEVVDQPVRDVLERIASQNQFKLLVDARALSDEGLSTDSMVNLQIFKLPLGTTLKKILEPLQLTYVVHEGVLIVTTLSRSQEMLSIRLYDVSDCRGIQIADPRHGLVPMITQVTQAKWLDQHGEGGAAILISSKHLLVCQTQPAQAEIELLIDDLSNDESAVTADLPLVVKVYSVSDSQTAEDLRRLLPQLIRSWQGSPSRDGVAIHVVGRSLIINQTSAVHDQIEELVAVLADSESRHQVLGPSGRSTTDESDKN